MRLRKRWARAHVRRTASLLPGKPRRAKPEDVEQRHIIQFLGSLNARVYVLGTRRRRGKPCAACGAFVANDDFSTHQTPGLADLEAFVPTPAARRGEPGVPAFYLLKVEVKAPGGRMSPHQERYRLLAQGCGPWVVHIVGGLNAVLAWALEQRFVRPEHVLHSRLPASIPTQAEPSVGLRADDGRDLSSTRVE